MKAKYLLGAATLALLATAPALAKDKALDLVEPIAEYKLYVTEKVERLVKDTSEFTAAVKAGNRDREKPHGSPLPHHRAYGSRTRRFDGFNSYRGARLGNPRLLK